MRASLLACAFLVTVLFALCSAPGAQAAEASPARPASWATPVDLKYAENFFQVDKELYRAAQPDAEAMRNYETFGIRTVINLRANHADDDEAKGTGLLLKRIPITTWAVSDKEVIDVLALIRTSEKPILVHCMHGADRTGLMMGMYRIVEQGWTKEEALAELQNGGYGFHSVWTNIPDYITKVDVASVRAAVDAKAPR